MPIFSGPHRDEVFIAGGQPQITYVKREELHVERVLARAIATPNQIVSLSGPTKTGKTVLCKRVLSERQYVWIDGGKIASPEIFWETVCGELNIPLEVETTEEVTEGNEVGLKTVVTASGSRLEKKATKTKKINGINEAIEFLLSQKILLVVDDFHYIDKDSRMTLMRNVKGSVFRGLKVILLSVTHRAFDAIKAESELTGRFAAVNIPEWSSQDLQQIALLGFSALKVDYSGDLVGIFSEEAQGSPFLMQRFCWEVCFDCNIERSMLLNRHTIPPHYDIQEMLVRLAKDSGTPVYERLVTGPQSRKQRTKRPLKYGGEVDIYEATLLALAETGPKSSVSYEELRGSLTALLTSMMPQKHEITSALKHLANISLKQGTDTAIDWDEDKREINVTDPYLRFFLRWQIRNLER